VLCNGKKKNTTFTRDMSSVRPPTRGYDVLWLVEWDVLRKTDKLSIQIGSEAQPLPIYRAQKPGKWGDTEGMDVCVVLSCVGRGLAGGRFPVQGVSLNAYKQVVLGSMSNKQEEDDFMLQLPTSRAFATNASLSVRLPVHKTHEP
jgi:hypothetical protein